MLDLSHIHLSTQGVARFPKKTQAAALAKARGWNHYDVIQAFNRFQIFWVVGERLDGIVRLAAIEAGDVRVPFRPTH